MRYIGEQKNELDLRTRNLEKREASSLTYLDWYKNLNLELFDLYNIKLEEEVGSFVNLFNDFKHHDYNSLQLVKEDKLAVFIRDGK